ncbi:MAG: glycosyltransferase family 4 protein [Bryobacteraceae bacterium]|nr:glycosyltransferase family 4 protein [Bryobacteraceae bacterium]
MGQALLFQHWKGVFGAVVANSESVRKELELGGISPVDVIWNGVPAGAEPAPLSPDPVAVFAGRLVPEKGVDALLEAFSSVSRGELLIAGIGPERSRLEQLAITLGLSNQVRFLGQLNPDELSRSFSGAWVQVVPSRWSEPFGFVAIEAMMRGAAVIATNSGGLSEIVRHNTTGMLVQPGAVAELTNALNAVLSCRETAERFGAAGRARALVHFLDTNWVDQFVRIYERLIEIRKGEYSHHGRNRRPQTCNLSSH